MLQDKGPRFTLGFGIQHSEVPNTQSPNVQTGLSANSNLISRALYDHPLARFFAVSAATLAGVAVSSSLVKEGGIRLGRKLVSQELPSWVSRDARNAFNIKRSDTVKQYRGVQRLLDQFEGISRADGRVDDVDSWEHRNELQNMLKEHPDRSDDFIPGTEVRYGDVPQWGFRDEIQKRLVHQARTLPYTLPALYVSSRTANAIVGNQNQPVNWKNPLDVIGDFAQESLKNIAVIASPFEIGSAAFSTARRSLYSEGDFAANTSVFSPHMQKAKQAAVSLRSVLDRMGQDSTKLIHQVTRRSSQASGSFSVALDEAQKNRQPIGFVGFRLRDGKLGFGDSEYSRYGFKRLKLIENAHKASGWEGAIRQAIPTLSGFQQGFLKQWNQYEERFQNAEAVRRNATKFSIRNWDWRSGEWKVEEREPNRRKIRPDSYLNRVASSLDTLNPAGRQRAFLETAKSEAYRTYFQEELAQRLTQRGLPGAFEEATNFANNVNLNTPRRGVERSAHEHMMDRISFGGRISEHHNLPTWEETFTARIKAITPHGKAITDSLADTVEAADARFLQDEKQIHSTAHKQWHDIRRRIILPEVRRQLGEIPLGYSEAATTPGREFLVRRTAEHMGIVTRHGDAIVPTGELKNSLAELGIDTTHHWQMRAMAMRRGLVRKPWQSGFNVLGLRPLAFNTALKKGYFGQEHAEALQNIHTELDKLDYPKGLVNRPVDRFVWESRSGRIVDLNPTFHGLRDTAQSIARNLEIPLLHFSPLDLTSINQKLELTRNPVIQITPSRFRHFGTVNRDLPQDQYGFHIWMGGSKAKGGLGRIFGYGGLDRDIGIARGRYYAPDATRGGTWQKNMAIAWGNRGRFIPEEELNESDRRKRLRHVFKVGHDQPSSFFDLWQRVKTGEFGHRHLGLPPDVRNPAVLARQILAGDTPNYAEMTPEWQKGFANLEKELQKFHFSPAIISRLPKEIRDALTVKGLGGEVQDLSEIRDANELKAITNNIFDEHVAQAGSSYNRGEISREQRNSIESAQNYIRRVYGADEPEALTRAAPRSASTAGINVRMDEMRADLYRYLIARQAIMAGEDSGQVIQKLLSSVEEMSRKGFISGSQMKEARAAVLSMQVNLLGLGIGLPEEFAGFAPTGERLNDLERAYRTLSSLGRSPARDVLSDISNYDLRLMHHRRFFGMEEKISRAFLKHFGVRKEEFKGIHYNPYGAEQKSVFLPSFWSTLDANPVKALTSIAGLDTWVNPESFSALSIRTSHLATRLNRVFQYVGLGVDETAVRVNPWRRMGFKYDRSKPLLQQWDANRVGNTEYERAFKGPLGFLNSGLVGRRVFPLVAGTAAFMAADRTLGGIVHGKDEYGNRQYKPLVTGALATGLAWLDIGAHGVFGGPDAAREKYAQMFGDEDVPIRRGRYWPIGNQPIKGGRVMYYRPNWYKRFMSGYQYTSEEYESPIKRLLWNYDFSPGHYLSPYHFERKHYLDRPYPVTGDMFSGPWGPLTTELNATVGRILKPHKLMHQDEMAEAFANNYKRVGMYGMAYTGQQNPYAPILTRSPSGGTMVSYPSPSSHYLVGPEQGGAAADEGYTQPYNQPYGFIGMPHGTHPETALASYRGANGAVGFAPGDADNLISTQGPVQFGGNKFHPYSRVHMARGGLFDQSIMPAANPINPGHLYYQAGQFGYEAEEMAGIYGFAFGAGREKIGLGNQNFTPQYPVLQQSSRAYGAERSWWDLNLGGLGDFPTPLRGEYGNLEFSEIARRFIPHRRREMNEINPIPNLMGKQYPWLPSNGDYFTTFDTGDPYTSIMEGEMRLPGPSYTRLHDLHPDQTGQYGLLDQHRILGDVAPWSEEYRAIDRILRKQRTSSDQKAYAQETRNRVAQQKKRHEFYAYDYAHADFQDQEATVVGFAPGDADTLITNLGPVSLAGIRARRTDQAMKLANSLIHAGDTVRLHYDANAPITKSKPLSAQVFTPNGEDFGEQLVAADMGYPSRLNTQLDNRLREGALKFGIHRILERLSHANSIINSKFIPHRSAVEDWERYHVYGTDFPTWNHPIRDYIEPLGQRAMNRNPILAGIIMGGVGRAFGRTPQGKAAGSFIGAGLGVYLSLTSNARTLETGSRYVPSTREKEFAVDEYIDILNYTKYQRLYQKERQQAIDHENADPEKYARRVEGGKYKQYQYTNLGPHMLSALQYRKKAQQTEYGADLFGDVMNEMSALPKRKRDYFAEFINAPMNERPRILSTAPRLERRMYEARWGMAIEKRPDLVDYFENHELPDSGWEGWDPNMNLDDVKLKVLQHQGLDASQVGYFPQQIQESNLINPVYPDFAQRQSHDEALQKLQALMNNAGIKGRVTMRPTNSSGSNINLQMGIR